MLGCVEITSGGTPGPRLDEAFHGLDNNVHGRVFDISLDDLALLFARTGWRVRRSSWTDYEVEREWVELELELDSTGCVLFAGVIDPARVGDLAAAFAEFGLECAIEPATPEI